MTATVKEETKSEMTFESRITLPITVCSILSLLIVILPLGLDWLGISLISADFRHSVVTGFMQAFVAVHSFAIGTVILPMSAIALVAIDMSILGPGIRAMAEGVNAKTCSVNYEQIDKMMRRISSAHKLAVRLAFILFWVEVVFLIAIEAPGVMKPASNHVTANLIAMGLFVLLKAYFFICDDAIIGEKTYASLSTETLAAARIIGWHPYFYKGQEVHRLPSTIYGHFQLLSGLALIKHGYMKDVFSPELFNQYIERQPATTKVAVRTILTLGHMHPDVEVNLV